MDTQTAARLVAEHSQAVYRLAYVRTGSREDAEDIVQETLLRLVRAEPELLDSAHQRAWLLRVAANCVTDLRRSAWKRHTRPLEDARDLPAPDEPEGGVLEAVLTLPERYRTVVHLYYYEDLSTAEIAQVLGIRRGAVTTRLSRARAMLRDVLTEEGERDG